MLRMQAATKIILQDVQQRLTKLEEALKTRFPFIHENKEDLIAQFLPCTTIDAIKDFDLLLKTTDEAVVQYVSL